MESNSFLVTHSLIQGGTIVYLRGAVGGNPIYAALGKTSSPVGKGLPGVACWGEKHPHPASTPHLCSERKPNRLFGSPSEQCADSASVSLGSLGEGENMASSGTQEVAVLPEQYKSRTQLSATESPAPEAFVILLDSIFPSLFLFVFLCFSRGETNSRFLIQIRLNFLSHSIISEHLLYFTDNAYLAVVHNLNILATEEK